MSEPAENNEIEETIKLDQFLKLADLAPSGGAAKQLIRSGVVKVNGEEEVRRGRKLHHGDVVTLNGEDYVIEVT
jgi:ribosome-associated protein